MALTQEEEVFQKQYNALYVRNHDLGEHPVIGFQAENSMLRIERRLHHGPTDDCITCGDPIPAGRKKAIPETLWCVTCSDEYDRGRRRLWTLNPNCGKGL